MTTYFIFAGEASGDLHGSHLIRELHTLRPSSTIWGVGGPRMRQENFENDIPMEEFQVMGFSDVLLALPKLWKLFHQILDQILKKKPDCVILIDYPGFNLRLARSLRKKGFQGKIVQYICPTVWAHGKNRIEIVQRNYDLLLTIFPFEAKYFEDTPLRVKYIGNPLVETIEKYPYASDWMKKMGMSDKHELIALFPGSRLGEIQKHALQQVKIAAQIREQYPNTQFALSCAQDHLREILSEYIRNTSLKLNQDIFLIPGNDHYNLMKNATTALAKSGTVNLELALHGIPTIVHYELSSFNYLFAKYLLKLSLPYYCIVNILANQTVFPEFIGRQLKLEKIKEGLEKVHGDFSLRTHIQNECQKIKKMLGKQSSHSQAAQAIGDLIPC